MGPSKDMVLGCYYLTAENPRAQREQDYYFASMDDVILAFEQEKIELHQYIWVRFDGEVEDDEPTGEPEVEQTADGGVIKLYKGQKTGKRLRRVREDAEGTVVSQYIRTTPGRVIYNQTILEALVG